MLKILVVDDSVVVRKQIIKVMDDLGHKVLWEAKNTAEAQNMYEQCQPDLVTMDITMQGLDGIYATQSIMRYDSKAKIIMITSHGQEDMVVDSIRSGALGYILKPITTSKVSKILKKIFPNEIQDDEESLDN